MMIINLRISLFWCIYFVDDKKLKKNWILLTGNYCKKSRHNIVVFKKKIIKHKSMKKISAQLQNCWDNQNEYDALHSSFLRLHIQLIIIIMRKITKESQFSLKMCSLNYYIHCRRRNFIKKMLNIKFIIYCQACMSKNAKRTRLKPYITSVFF